MRFEEDDFGMWDGKMRQSKYLMTCLILQFGILKIAIKNKTKFIHF